MSAFAPIVNPSKAPWGIKAFTGYLGGNQDAWKQYDASELIANYASGGSDKAEILIDQGEKDEFKAGQLLPENFVAAAKKAGYPVVYREQAGYDHSYYFVASFIGDHIKHHARFLAWLKDNIFLRFSSLFNCSQSNNQSFELQCD